MKIHHELKYKVTCSELLMIFKMHFLSLENLQTNIFSRFKVVFLKTVFFCCRGFSEKFRNN